MNRCTIEISEYKKTQFKNNSDVNTINSYVGFQLILIKTSKILVKFETWTSPLFSSLSHNNDKYQVLWLIINFCLVTAAV